MIPYKQLTLAEVFEDCQNKFDNDKFQFVELRKSKLTQFLNSTQTAVSVVPLLVLCWYHRTIK